MQIAFFDTKPYDKPSFERLGNEQEMTFKFFETKLNEDTASLAAGCDAVCVFVNDTVNAAVIDKLTMWTCATRSAKSTSSMCRPIRPTPSPNMPWRCF